MPLIPTSARSFPAAFFRPIGRAFSKPFRQGTFFYFGFKEMLNGSKTLLVFLAHQGYSLPVVVGTGRTADAMHIIFGIVRHIEIDDQLDIVDVDAARHDVRSHQHVDLLGFELIHHFVTLLLFQIRVHGTDLKSGTP